jgi:hypothetical protein
MWSKKNKGSLEVCNHARPSYDEYLAEQQNSFFVDKDGSFGFVNEKNDVTHSSMRSNAALHFTAEEEKELDAIAKRQTEIYMNAQRRANPVRAKSDFLDRVLESVIPMFVGR